MSRDVEAGPMQRTGREGYIAAASWLVRDADSETLVFRKFNKLAALNLMYMQSELLEIEEKITHMHDKIEDSGDMDLKEAARRWESLREQSEEESSKYRVESRSQMELIIHLRTVIKEYHEALVLQSQIEQLHRPEERVVKTLKHFFSRPYPILLGKAKTFLDNSSDLVALKSSSEDDYISRCLRKHLVEHKETANDGNLYGRFSESTITQVVNVVTIIVAAVFLFGSIIGFYFVQNPIVKLVMIAVFTSFFATSLGLITSAKRVEIFGATAAYAAVLVVFTLCWFKAGSIQLEHNCRTFKSDDDRSMASQRSSASSEPIERLHPMDNE